MSAPTSQTFGEILDEIESGHLEETRRALDASWDAIVAVLTETPGAADGKEQPVRWRGGVKEHEQTAPEKEHVRDICSTLGLDWQRASVLLRDFLKLLSAPIEELSRADFRVKAPLEELRLFLMEERRAQFGCIASVVKIADDPSHPAYEVCRALLDKSGVEKLGNSIPDHATALTEAMATPSLHEFEDLQRQLRWTVELGFIFFYGNPCSAKTMLRIVQLGKGGRLEWSASRTSRTTLAFALTFVESLSLEGLVAAQLGHGDVGGEGSQERTPAKYFGSEDRDRITQALLKNGSSRLELAIMALAWATFLSATEGDERGPEIEKLMVNAMSADVLEELPRALTLYSRGGVDSLEASPTRIGAVSGGMVSSFLTAFPPVALTTRHQLHTLARLCAHALSYSPELCRTVVAAELDLDGRGRGVNVVIRKAQALFPEEMEPLVLILGSLCADEECAAAVVELISEALGTYAEASTDRSLEYPLPEDDAGFADAKKDVPFLEALAHVPVGVLVRNRSDEAGESSVRIPPGVVGFTTEDMTTLVWHLRWNGWIILRRELEDLMDRLRSGAEIGPIDKVLTICNLVIRLCVHGDAKVLDFVANGAVPAELVSDLLVLVTRRRSGIERPAKRTLLTLLSSCLLHMVRRDPHLADSALRRVGVLQAQTSTLHEILRFGGVTAPALRTVLNIAEVVPASSGVTDHLMDFLTTEVLPMWLSSRRGVSGRVEQVSSWRLLQSVFALLGGHLSAQAARSPTVAQAIAATLAVCDDTSAKSKPSAAYYCALKSAMELACQILRMHNQQIGAGDEAKGAPPETTEELVVASALDTSSLAKIAANAFASLVLALPTTAFDDEVEEVENPALEGLVHRVADNMLTDTRDGFDVPTSSELQDLAARCLGSLFLLLSRSSMRASSRITQVSWPTGDVSQAVRRGLAQSISKRRSFWHLNMVLAAVTCGQRGVSRALLKSTGSVVKLSDPKEGEPPEGQAGEGSGKDASPVISATCDVLRGVMQDTSFQSRGAGRTASAAVQVLRAAWKEYGTIWLRSVFKSLKVWSVLGSMVSTSGSFQPLTAISLAPQHELSEDADLDEEGWFTDAATATDEAAEWRVTLANVIYALASELMATAPDLSGADGGAGTAVRERRGGVVAQALRDVCCEGWLDIVFAERCIREYEDSPDPLASTLFDELSGELGEPLKAAADDGERFFGSSYMIDGAAVLDKLVLKKVDEERRRRLAADICRLNVAASRLQSYAQLIAAFGAANVATAWLDGVKPPTDGLPSVALMGSENSGGANDLQAYLTELFRRSSTLLLNQSPSTLPVRTEVAAMLAMLSKWMSKTGDEFASPSRHAVESTTIANISAALRTSYGESIGSENGSTKYNVALLLTAARLAQQSQRDDLAEFVDVVADAFDRGFVGDGDVLAASAAALTKVPSSLVGRSLRVSLRGLALSSKLPHAGAVETAECMLQLLLRVCADASVPTSGSRGEILDALSGGLMSSMSLSADDLVGYDSQTLERSPKHRLHCALLKVASVQLAKMTESRPDVRSVLSLTSSLYYHIVEHSLQVTGDWPPVPDKLQQSAAQYVTLARLKEADAACTLLWALAGHAVACTVELPGVVEVLVQGLMLFIYQAYRLLRAEPIERWVLPVSSEEMEMSNKEEPSASADVVASKTKDTPPAQTAREAIGRRYMSVPPSPLMPPTPMTAMNTHVTPDTPGASAEAPVQFGELALQTLLRALGSALGALRRFDTTTSIPPVAPTMALSADRCSLGLLVAIQLHATHELQRGLEGTHRSVLHIMAENALFITISQTMRLRAGDLLPAGVREELRKRLQTIVDRQRQLVPPLPRGSLIHAPEMTAFLRSLS